MTYITKKMKLFSETDFKAFKQLLLSLTKETKKTFNHFGTINLKTVNQIIDNEISNLDKIKFFIFNDDELIGYGFLNKFKKPEKKHTCILGIVISDKWQSKGIGRTLLQKMIKSAWADGFTKIWLNLHYDNKQAFRLYTSQNFEIEGIFMNEEIFEGKKRHLISMALFKNKKSLTQNRLDLLKKLM
jgi:RimJ/RimL family protein N-acetyltransferase|tara:strand:- start:79 stop:636 length:558 start_codon:yes stop_codon:yes gene_type:complete